MKQDLRVRWLGRINFAAALTLQEDLVARKRQDQSSIDELLLLEHEPVYTIGRSPDRSSLLGASHLPYPLFPINRGGQATYHGPGQLIGYPIVDLRRCGQDLHRYLRWLEETLIETLAHYKLSAVQDRIHRSGCAPLDYDAWGGLECGGGPLALPPYRAVRDYECRNDLHRA